MRVTNEQAKAEVFCSEKDCSAECPSYPGDGCDNDKASRADYAADLLDARELIKEMRGELESSRAQLEGYEAWETGETYNSPSLNNILDKSKEYAE